jgi:orotidine-5'-phosphate decarboxylase
MGELFARENGIIPACDMAKLDELAALVKATCRLPFIAGYKIGMALGLSNGLRRVVEVIRQSTSLPIIYDHQKFGTDVPDLCGESAARLFASAGVDAVIIFPQAGVRTLEASVEALRATGIVPIVGGEMTHPGYLSSEGGYIDEHAPLRMYRDAASLGVKLFVVPGTRVESMQRYKSELSALVERPSFLFPGIGRGQGGDILAAFRAVAPLPSFAIVGRGITAEEDKEAAATRLWSAVANEIPLDR